MQRLLLGRAYLYARRPVQHPVPQQRVERFRLLRRFRQMRIGLAVLDGKLKWTPKLLEIIYADPLCGACDVGCKRNLDLEIELTLEALRVKAVKDGAGPMPAHKKIAENIDKKQNQFGAPAANRKKWVTKDIKVAPKADILYFAGCSSSYVNPEIAQATAKILNGSGTPFMMLANESCCGNTVYSVGMVKETKKIAKANIDNGQGERGEGAPDELCRVLQDVEGRLSESP